MTAVINHDAYFILLAVGICALASLTGAAITQHALKAETRKYRLLWLMLAAAVISLGVWTTDFTALLGFRTDLGIRYDLRLAVLSLVVSVGLISIGGVAALMDRDRGILAGAIVGLGIALAHFLDMETLHLSGIVAHGTMNIALATAFAILLGACAGYFLVRFREATLAWPAGLTLCLAVLVTYFIAMKGATFQPSGEHVHSSHWTASGPELASAVSTAFLLLLTGVILYALHTERTGRKLEEEHRQLQKALSDLKETQSHHQAYLDLNPQVAWVASPDGRVIEAAPKWVELVGQPLDYAMGDRWMNRLHPEDRPRVARIWMEALATGPDEGVDIRFRILLAGGNYRWFRARARPRRDASGQILAWYGTLEDVNDQIVAEIALRESEERYRLAALATSEVIWEWSFETRNAKWSGAYREVLGYPELDHRTDMNWWREHIHPDDVDRVIENQRRAIQIGADTWNDEYRFRVSSGDWIDVRTRGVIVRDENGAATRFVGSMRDITQQKRAEAELNWAASHDPLTKLPNRHLFSKRQRAAIHAARDAGQFVAIALLDLNDFKEVNDLLGHAAGDHILEEIARRVQFSLPDDATMARLGGDEFAIVLPGLSSPGAYKEHMARVSACFAQPVAVQNMNVQIRYCAGVAVWPRDSEDPADLLIAADLALYAAKNQVPGTVVEFDSSLREAADRRMAMLAAARQALEEDRVIPFYQPKVDLRTGKIIGWEALLRIRGNGTQILPPSEIEAAFSDAEISVQLTDRMFCRVLADLARWQAAGIAISRIAVNLSASDFRQKGLSQRLMSIAARHGMPLKDIDVEVTETVLIGDLGPEVSHELQTLRNLGVLVALDDFGTGYASLTHLQQLPVDVIKIDRSFVEKIDATDPKATAVTDAVIQMAKRLGMLSVAEGVETWEQAQYLKGVGCDVIQGYLFSRPLPAEKVPAFLSSPAVIVTSRPSAEISPLPA